MWRAAASLLSFEACVLEDIFWRLLLPIVLSDDEAFHLVNEAARSLNPLPIPRNDKHVAGPSNFERSKGTPNSEKVCNKICLLAMASSLDLNTNIKSSR